jgi:hypothetical protein
MLAPFSRAALRLALNERGALIRDVERTGLRRVMLACGGFLAVKYIKTRVLGAPTTPSKLTRVA